MRFAATSLVAIATAVLAVAQPLAPALPANSPSVPQTNAKRFAAGLPPLPPKSRRHSDVLRGGKLTTSPGSKVDTARRASASPSVGTSTKCNIQVRKASDGSSVGYIGGGWSTIGVRGLQSITTGALEVSFTYSLDKLSQIDMLSTATPAAEYPYFGATSASGTAWDLEPNALRYAYIASTAQTPQGSPPVQSTSSYSTLAKVPESRAESAIWKYDPVTRAITAQWVNSDGSLPATYLAYAPGKLMITGDLTRLASGVLGAIPVTLTCIPTATS